MKIYSGSPDDPGGTFPVVVRKDHHAPYPLRHHFRYTPAGFAWGYQGTAPKELARCLLIDVLSRATCCEDAEATQVCPNQGVHPWVARYLVRFRDEVIAGLDLEKPWKLSNYEIADWVLDRVTEDRDVDELMTEMDSLSPA